MIQNYLHSLVSFNSSSSSSSTLYLLSLSLLLITSTIEGRTTVPAIFTFGDSFADQGNNRYFATRSRCDFLPYGKDFMGGNHPTGRYSNGKTFADLIAGSLGIKEFVPPYLDPNLQLHELLTGVSFGSGSSGYDPQTPAASSVLSLPKQLELFTEYIEKTEGHASEDSIFLVIAGTGDLANTYFLAGERRKQYTVDSYTNFLVELASKFVQDLYALGAKKIFVFGVPPVGCLPLGRTLKGGILRNCSEEENEAARMYNTKLWNSLTSINSSLSTDPKVYVSYVDFYNPLHNLIEHQREYGFEVADRGCCGTGFFEIALTCNPITPTCHDDMAYLFWDSFHATEHGNTLLVNQFLKNSFNIFL